MVKLEIFPFKSIALHLVHAYTESEADSDSNQSIRELTYYPTLNRTAGSPEYNLLGRRCNTTASSQNDRPSVAGIPISVAPSSVARKSSTSGQHVSKQPVREVLNTFLPDVSVRKPRHFDTFLKSRSIDSKQPVRNPLHTQCHRVCDLLEVLIVSSECLNSNQSVRHSCTRCTVQQLSRSSNSNQTVISQYE